MRTKRTTKQQQTAVIYARARGESLDEENHAIQAQLRACREWAEKNRYTVTKEYVDRGKSTFHILEKREALKELLNDTVNEQWSFNLVIVHGFDRLFRNVVELEAFRAILGREHVKLISVTDDMLWYYGRVAQGANSYPSRISVS